MVDLSSSRENQNKVQPVSILGREENLRNRVVVGALILLLVVSYLGSQEEDLIKIDASIIPGRLSKGNEGRVVLKFRVKEGIIINPQPSFMIEISPSNELVFSKNFFTASDLRIEILKEEGKEYLVLNQQIEITFTVSGESIKGTHSLKGKVKYFAYSKAENWCLKTTSLFTASFYTR